MSQFEAINEAFRQARREREAREAKWAAEPIPKEQTYFESGAWFAFDHILGWINTQTEQSIDKAKLYEAVMSMRPDAIKAETKRRFGR